MLSPEEIGILRNSLRDGFVEVFFVLLLKKVYQDYNITLYKKQNYYQFGLANVLKIKELLGDKLTNPDDEELNKTINGLYHRFAQTVQQSRLNE